MRRSLALFLLFSACGEPGTARVDFRRVKPPNTTGGVVVAKIAGDSITTDELAVRFAEMTPYARVRYQTVDQRRDYVDGLIRFELLAQEAVRRGLASDPEVLESTKRAMVQRLLRVEVDEQAASVSAEKVAEYYQAHQSDYVKPAMTRLAHLFVAVPNRAKAESLLAEARALPRLDYASFQRLARERSEDAESAARDGDLRFLTDEALGGQYGAEVLAAAARLKEVGEVSPALVSTPRGWHVLKLLGRQAPLHLSLEQARPSIQSILANESKQERFQAVLERLKKTSHYQLNEEALASIVIDPKAPAAPPTTPPPTSLPGPPPKPAEHSWR